MDTQTFVHLVSDEHHLFWLEQNSSKHLKWGTLAREGHDVAWEFEGPGGRYTGRMLIDGEVYTPSEATEKFLKAEGPRPILHWKRLPLD